MLCKWWYIICGSCSKTTSNITTMISSLTSIYIIIIRANFCSTFPICLTLTILFWRIKWTLLLSSVILCITWMFLLNPFSVRLDMVILYNNCWCCLRSDYIRRNLPSDLQPLLLPFTSIVGGVSHHYVLLLVSSVTARRDVFPEKYIAWYQH